ncbi:MAG: 2-amino-4-hydroxy-6-hydroxymethyldihydropteridine diphosphokinase [Pseudomonadota bacterium]|jgi:2-amino-4-hydroxy-6-hydroxymethyldihydropteridine diphosphokinase
MTVRCYIGLGSNLADPQTQIDWAVTALGSLPASHLEAVAPRYRSRAMGPGVQPEYINTAVRLRTELAPLPLLRALQRLEKSRGRQRPEVRWGPRPLDLDILLYGQRQIATPQLTIPHPRLGQRNFVLAPLHDLDPELHLPDGSPIAELLARIGCEGIVRLADGSLQ